MDRDAGPARYHPAVHTRQVEPGDAAALLAIYNPEVTQEAVSFDIYERTLEDQLAWIEDHRGPHPAIVAVGDDASIGSAGASGEPILGFASVSPFRERAAYATTVEDSVYVHRGARGMGVGLLLLEDLLVAARDAGFHSVIGRIVGHNETSIRLHARCGFELVGVEREVGRKHGRWLDVVEMQRLL
jgi:phosphinothricin acetyltransferase